MMERRKGTTGQRCPVCGFKVEALHRTYRRTQLKPSRCDKCLRKYKTQQILD